VGEWRTTINGKEIDLVKVAELAVRPLEAPSFTVVLRDGRRVVVTPNPKRIGAYLITGEAFEKRVRADLAGGEVGDPAKVHVLEGIRVPGGAVPNVWGPDHVHVSIGEPLEHLARVEVQGKKGR
jgi:hypothetical protein